MHTTSSSIYDSSLGPVPVSANVVFFSLCVNFIEKTACAEN